MKLLLLNQSRDRVRKKWLENWIKDLARLLGKKGYKALARKELVVVFVTTGEIRRLNRLYRRSDHSTDILSFQPAEAGCVGELVLCLPIIRRQSRRTGLGERGELGYMLVHGVLHLLGFDHMKRKDEAKMVALQDWLYSELEQRVGLGRA
jgi:probable rRNA maturation factor